MNTTGQFIVPGNDPCVVCKGAGHCEPVPAKGRQGIWYWTPEAVVA